MAPLLIAILGPTASGKSDLALGLAERLDGEVVNYDSVQVYRGFDIGSAKTPESERRGVPHHLIDILDPAEQFSAGEYARRARAVLAEIRRRGRTPILAGGTGFYLRALLDGLFEGPGRDTELRARLERSAELRDPGYLHRLLARLDPESAARIHANDQPKLIRAIEVFLVEGESMTRAFERGLAPLEGFRIVRLGLAPPRAELYERINLRSRRMFEAGLLDEVRGLLDAGVPRDAWAFGALGYRQALACLGGRLSIEEAIEETARKTRNYAKRQLTWFRRQEPETAWFESTGDDGAALDWAFQTSRPCVRAGGTGSPAAG